METLTATATAASTGLSTALTGEFNTQRPGLWRPWLGHDERALRVKSDLTHCLNESGAKLPKTPQVVHPVKLFWPKSKCFDYLYQDAEMLLRNYPVQATICPYQDSSSDEDSDDDEEEMMEKELN